VRDLTSYVSLRPVTLQLLYLLFNRSYFNKARFVKTKSLNWRL